MKEYTFSEARQRLSSLLDRARKEGSVRIKRRDGKNSYLSPKYRINHLWILKA